MIVLQPISVVNSAVKSLKSRNFFTFCAQSYTIAASKQLAMHIVATGVVVDAIAIANVEAVLGAIPPDRALHKPRKRRREGRIELSSIDVLRDQAENASAPAWLVASGAVRMVSAQPLQDPGSVQEIVDQGVNGYQVAPTSSHSGRRFPALSSRYDMAIAKTLSATP